MAIVSTQRFPNLRHAAARILGNQQHGFHAEHPRHDQIAWQVFKHGCMLGVDPVQAHELVIGIAGGFGHIVGRDNVKNIVKMIENAELTSCHFSVFHSAVCEDELASWQRLDRLTQSLVRRDNAVIDIMGMIEEVQRIDIVMQHQPFQRGAMIPIIALLNNFGFIGWKLQQIGHIGIHIAVYLRKQIHVMRIERIVEIKNPFVDMGEIRLGRCAGDLGHADLMAQAARVGKAKNAGLPCINVDGLGRFQMLCAIMQTWILITFCSAFLQNLRSVLQKHLKTKMGTTGATFVRFGFGVPFSLAYLGFQVFVLKDQLPTPNWSFAMWEVVGALSQIMATFLLVHMFSYRNFAVGTAYSRTEPAQAALFALIFLGERVNVPTMLAISISVVGVMLISVARTEISWKSLGTSITSRTAQIGLLSGTLFGISAVAYRSASLSLASSLDVPNYIMQASYTSTVVIILQTAIMLVWIVLKEPGELIKMRKAWVISLAVGFVGATGSFGWFMAMTLQHAAVVKALAQVEMLFTFASSVFIFKEHINRYEIAGCLLIVFGILALLLF